MNFLLQSYKKSYTLFSFCSIFQNEELAQQNMQNDPFIIEEGEAADALFFSGVTSVGAVLDDPVSRNAAAHFAGYVGLKLSNYHLKRTCKSIVDCSGCNNIFIPQDFNLHLFSSFKEYEQNVDSS